MVALRHTQQALCESLLPTQDVNLFSFMFAQKKMNVVALWDWPALWLPLELDLISNFS